MKKLIFLSSCFLLSACATQSPKQAQLDHCQSLMQAKNYSQAIFACVGPANRGVPEAQYAMGYLYANGDGVTADQQMAKFWISKAAKQGNLDAIAALSALDKNDPDAKGSVFND